MRSLDSTAARGLACRPRRRIAGLAGGVVVVLAFAMLALGSTPLAALGAAGGVTSGHDFMQAGR
jgi:hypothetical protein